MPDLITKEPETKGVIVGDPAAGSSSPRWRRFSPRFSLGILIVAVLALAVWGLPDLGWTPAGTATGLDKENQALPDRGREVVTAELRPISSVLVFDASLVANPIFRLPAPSDGVVSKLADGRVAIKGALDTTAQPIAPPPSSKIISLLVEPGTTVTAGLPIIDAQYTGFALQVKVPPEKVFRLNSGIISARGEITNGPGPFDSSVLGIPFVPGSGGYAEPEAPGADSAPAPAAVSGDSTAAAGQGDSTATAPAAPAPVNGTASTTTKPVPIGVQTGWSTSFSGAAEGVVVIGAIPTDLKVLEGLPGLLALKVAETTDAVALPVEAVAGISQRGQVYVEEGGKRALRDVTLGLTDGSYIQILSGIDAGEKVFLPAPSIANLK